MLRGIYENECKTHIDIGFASVEDRAFD